MVLYKQIQKEFAGELCFGLLQVQMVYLQCANGRRPGVIDKVSKIDFKNRKSIQEDEEFHALDNATQNRLKSYKIMIVDGKKMYGLDGRIYITKIDEEILEYLVENRRMAGIRSKNEMLFAEPGELEGFINAHDAMKSLKNECHKNVNPIKDLKNLTATGIRKYLATKNKDDGNARISRHLSHSDKTHNEYYVVPVAKEVADITEYLEKNIGYINDSIEAEGSSDSECVVDSSLDKSGKNIIIYCKIIYLT